MAGLSITLIILTDQVERSGKNKLYPFAPLQGRFKMQIGKLWDAGLNQKAKTQRVGL
jgi:hypothetical protein